MTPAIMVESQAVIRMITSMKSKAISGTSARSTVSTYIACRIEDLLEHQLPAPFKF